MNDSYYRRHLVLELSTYIQTLYEDVLYVCPYLHHLVYCSDASGLQEHVPAASWMRLLQRSLSSRHCARNNSGRFWIAVSMRIAVIIRSSKNEFLFLKISSYAYSGRPVVIKNALTNWTALNVFSYEFFRDLYTKEASSTRSHRCQFFPYKTEFRSLNEALTMSEERFKQPWYFGWSNCDSDTAGVLRHHYSRPYFLPERSESSRTDWIFMGTAGLGAHMHVRDICHGWKWPKDASEMLCLET